MADKTISKVKVKNRIDTATNWSTANPTLLAGEIGIATEADSNGAITSYRMKVGDGTTKWSSLPFITNNSQKLTFSMAKGATTATITNAAITPYTTVSEIGYTTGKQYFQYAGEWETSKGTLTLTFTSGVTGDCAGYVIIY